MARETKALANVLLHGWGYVEGKWVFVPLWDPPKAFGRLYAGAAIADAAKLISNRQLAAKLSAAAKDLLSTAIAGFLKAFEDGDPICPPYPWPFPHWPHWPPFPFPWPGPGPGPGPDPGPYDQFFVKLSPAVRDEIIGNLVVSIGNSLGDKSVIAIGRAVMGNR